MTRPDFPHENDHSGGRVMVEQVEVIFPIEPADLHPRLPGAGSWPSQAFPSNVETVHSFSAGSSVTPSP